MKWGSLVSLIKRRICRATDQIHRAGLTVHSRNTYHGGWSDGYDVGRRSAYEDILDIIEEDTNKNAHVTIEEFKIRSAGVTQDGIGLSGFVTETTKL